MTSVQALRQFLFFVWDLLDDAIKSMVEVIGERVDSIVGDYAALVAEVDIYSATVDGLLPEYERYYHVVPQNGDTLDARRLRVIAALRSRGNYNLQKFENIAEGLGYVIGNSGLKYLIISDADFPPFRAGISRAGIDAVYDYAAGSSPYTVLVTGTGVEADYDLQFLFNKRKCLGIEIVFVDV